MACNMNGFQGIFNVLPTSLDSQKQLGEMGNTGITTPILKMVKPRLREVTCFIQGQDQSAAPVSTKSCFLFSPWRSGGILGAAKQLPPQCSTLHQLVDNSLIKCWRSLARDQELSYLCKISLQKHFSLFIPPPHWNAKIFTVIGQITSCRLVIFQGKDEKHVIRLGIFNCLAEWKEPLARSWETWVLVRSPPFISCGTCPLSL